MPRMCGLHVWEGGDDGVCAATAMTAVGFDQVQRGLSIGPFRLAPNIPPAPVLLVHALVLARPDRSHRRLDLLHGLNCATINAGAMPILWRAS